MLWSYHWRVISPGKEGRQVSLLRQRCSSTSSHRDRNGLRQLSGGFAPPDLSIRLGGSLETQPSEQAVFAVREFPVQKSPVRWGGCFKRPQRVPGRAHSGPSALQRSSPDFRQQRAAARQVLQLLLNGWFVFFLSGLQKSDEHLWAAAILSQQRHCRATLEHGLLLGKLRSQALLLKLLTNL